MSNESKFMTPDDLAYYDGKIKDHFTHEMDEQTHDASDVNSGTFDTARLPVVPIDKGGTNASTAREAQFNLLEMGYYPKPLTDTDLVVMVQEDPTPKTGMVYKNSITKFWEYIKTKIQNGFGFNASGVLDIAHGGTGSANAADARNAIGAAAASHAHAADDITSGVLDVARIPVDSALSATSVNPVQNKAVQGALSSKQDKLVAGSNITIDPDTNTISAAGASGDLSAVSEVTAASPIAATRSGNSVSLSHAASGVAVGWHGPTADASPTWGESFVTGVRFTVDKGGHITSVSGRKVTLPSSTASSDAAGLMSADDKTKLDGIAAGAQANAVKSVNGKVGAVKLNASDVGAASEGHVHDASVITSGVLDVAHIPVDSAISSTSVNPVQNKVVQAALAGKQDSLVAGDNIVFDSRTHEIHVFTSKENASTPLDQRLRSLDTSVDKLTRYLTNQTQAALMNQRVHLGEDITEMFDNGDFSARIADGSFDGLALGQYIQKTITIAGQPHMAKAYLCDANLFYAQNKRYAMVNTPHIACVVAFNDLRHAWADSTTSTLSGYSGSSIRSYIQDTITTALQTAFGNQLLSHSVYLSNATSKENGESVSGAWFNNCYCELLSAAQCCGLNVGNYYDVGEAYHQLALFQHVSVNTVVENQWFWLRDIIGNNGVATIGEDGAIRYSGVESAARILVLILLR